MADNIEPDLEQVEMTKLTNSEQDLNKNDQRKQPVSKIEDVSVNFNINI